MLCDEQCSCLLKVSLEENSVEVFEPLFDTLF
jgi:hypothetical protein